MLGLIIVIITTFFFGKIAEKKGLDVLRWRIRHVCACIFTETLATIISLSINGRLMIAALTGLIALLALIVFRFQRLKQLPDHNS